MKTTRDNIQDYLVDSFNRNLKNRKEETIFGSIPVYINDSLPDEVNIKLVLQAIENAIPEHLAYGVEAIYVEHLEEFEKRAINAVYKSGSIYVTNLQDGDEDMIDDIVHEIAHSAETLYRKQIYSDKAIIDEFVGKRKRLLDILNQEGYNISAETFLDPNYSRQVDNFLYQKIGYPLLTTLVQGLFISPYSATSVREYFAIGFEEHFLKDSKYVKKICPKLYAKILELSSL